MDKETRPFVVHCVDQGRPSYGWMTRDASEKFKGREEIKIRNQPINTQNFVS